MLHNNDMCLFDLLDIVDVGRVVRIQNLIRYEANTGF